MLVNLFLENYWLRNDKCLERREVLQSPWKRGERVSELGSNIMGLCQAGWRLVVQAGRARDLLLV